MAQLQSDFESAVRIIGEAPFSAVGWDDALGVIGRAGGGWSAQLLAVHRTAGILTHRVIGIEPEAIDYFERCGGPDARVNPRAPALFGPVFQPLGDDDISSPEVQRRNPFYREFFDKVEIPYICVGRLPAAHDVGLIVASMRHQAAGHIQRSEARMFAELLPCMSAAMRLRTALEDEGAAIAAGTLDAVGVPAFLLNAWGRIVRQTASAEAALAAADVLRVRGGKLEALEAESDVRLQAAIALACLRDPGPTGGPRGRAVALRSGGQITIAEVAPLPVTPGALRMGAVAVVALPQVARTPAADVLVLLGLTPAEAAIARALVEGQRPQEIADVRATSVMTIRAQVRAIYAKLDVGSVAALAGRLRGLS
ncbi:MAG: transcriptional regulator,LuxR family [Phenylobacterium sp.]|nr:transcriptional regulator,LuxR family [Phenylobacterium sp.]